MINLFDTYSFREMLLEDSLKQAGYYNQTVVLNDNGYLPSHVLSPISFFTGTDQQAGKIEVRSKFFNELSVPPYWEISGDDKMATIFDGYQKKGNIFYHQDPESHRLISSVEWLNEEGRVRAIDLYNQYGQRFGRKAYSDGDHVLTTYFDVSDREVILMNHITQTIQVHYQEKEYIFGSYEDFIVFYFEVAQIETKQMCYNSLGHPHFISNVLGQRHPDQLYHHILFWQERTEEMPGNMRQLLRDETSPTKQIIVQDKSEYSRLSRQITDPSKVQISYLGFLYRFKRTAIFTPSIFILTNSDQIAHIEELIPLLLDYQIRIAARTEMSQKLMSLEKFPSVKLYPQVTDSEIDNLVSRTSVYLDINYGDEVGGILGTAFENNLLILGFNETLHNDQLMRHQNRFELSDYLHLSDKLNHLRVKSGAFVEEIRSQQYEAGHMTIKDYRRVLG